MGLREEFDFADSATAELDIVAENRDPPSAFVRMNLPLDRVNVLDRREVEVFTPKEGLQFLEESSSGGIITRDRPCLDESRAFSILTGALVVGESGKYR